MHNFSGYILNFYLSTGYADNLEAIFNYNSSVKVYMFFGETNFGFWVGANSDGNAPYYRPMTTSYGIWQ